MPKKTDNFSKFFNKKRNSAIKEERRQEKKTAKKERKAAIERHFEEKRKLKTLGQPQVEPRPQPQPRPKPGHQPPAPGPANKHVPARKPLGMAPPPARKAPLASSAPAARPSSSALVKPPAPAPSRKPPGAPPPATARKGPPPLPAKGNPKDNPKSNPRDNPKGNPKTSPKTDLKASPPAKAAPQGDQLPLNKYIAHGGICSRRDAAELIRQGKVQVNGQLVTEPGTKVSPKDQVKVNGKKVTMSRNLVYILLNKPKDYITTTDDPQGRRTVLDLIRQATPERVYPVGRLDRNTSGVLLLTNDGELAQKLAHPKHEIKKIYHVTLDKPLIKADFDKIVAGVTLEDGPAFVDVIAYADSHDKAQIGLEIHSGRNRIVRRIFEHLGYDVRGLDRVMYAGLTKKNVQRGKWRLLSEKEIRILKYLNNAKTRDHL